MERSERWHTAWRRVAGALASVLPRRSHAVPPAGRRSDYCSSVVAGVSDTGVSICDLPECGLGPRKVEIESMFRQPAPPPILNEDSAPRNEQTCAVQSWRVVGADGLTTSVDSELVNEAPDTALPPADRDIQPEARESDPGLDLEEPVTRKDCRPEPKRLLAAFDLTSSIREEPRSSGSRQNIGMPKATAELSTMLREDKASGPREAHPTDALAVEGSNESDGPSAHARMTSMAPAGTGLPGSEPGQMPVARPPFLPQRDTPSRSRRFQAPTCPSEQSAAIGPAGPASLLTVQNARPCRDIDARLARIIEVWSDLPHPVQQAMFAMVEAIDKEF